MALRLRMQGPAAYGENTLTHDYRLLKDRCCDRGCGSEILRSAARMSGETGARPRESVDGE